jgi:hypothetical protein
VCWPGSAGRCSARSSPSAGSRIPYHLAPEGCESGRIGWSRKPLWRKPPWVQIPLPPLTKRRCESKSSRLRLAARRLRRRSAAWTLAWSLAIVLDGVRLRAYIPTLTVVCVTTCMAAMCEPWTGGIQTDGGAGAAVAGLDAAVCRGLELTPFGPPAYLAGPHDAAHIARDALTTPLRSSRQTSHACPRTPARAAASIGGERHSADTSDVAANQEDRASNTRLFSVHLCRAPRERVAGEGPGPSLGNRRRLPAHRRGSRPGRLGRGDFRNTSPRNGRDLRPMAASPA